MSIFGLSLYILIWPVISLAVLGLLCVSLVRDIRAAKRRGIDLI
ncbi:putative transporter small subunit [Alcaligenaceae bacterium C4P045]|nr:putative transporter small subunit [Alcaligenaceae bacterium C4P045]